METKTFQKLNVNIPRQPLKNQKPWMVAGMLLAFVILIFTAYAYFSYRKQSKILLERTDLNKAIDK